MESNYCLTRILRVYLPLSLCNQNSHHNGIERQLDNANSACIYTAIGAEIGTVQYEITLILITAMQDYNKLIKLAIYKFKSKN